MFHYAAMPFMVGQLEKIMAVPGSGDWYVYLQNPIAHTQIGKLRIVLTPSPTFPLPHNVTLMATEYLDKPGVIVSKSKNKLQSFVSLPDLQSLIPETDALVALIAIDKNGTAVTDTHGAFLAEVLAKRTLSP